MLKELESYICTLDDVDKRMIDNNVAEKGIEKYLSQKLIYLDCSRIINDMRMMQTIGYPYQREITSYLYAAEKYLKDDESKYDYYCVLLGDRHEANLKYEQDNPPIWYGGKKAKEKWLKDKAGKLPRRRKVAEGTLPGMGKEISNTQRLKNLSAQFGKLTFKLKPTKKDD